MMIFGKITPVLSIATQDTLFNPSPDFITGSYMTAVAEKYLLGTNEVEFNIQYGECTFRSGSVVNFESVHSEYLVLSGSTITTWGEDDSVILHALATAQGTTITTVASGSVGRSVL